MLFAGTPEFAVPSLRALVAAGHDVAGVITRADAPLGRKRVLTPSPVAQVAEELGIAVRKSNRLDSDTAAWVQELQVELGVIVAYGGLVREPILTLPALGWVNLHFSELPRWRGAAPVQRALAAGEQRLGVTVFRLVDELDAGDVLTRDSRVYPEGTPAGAALADLSEAGTTALLAAVDTLGRDPDAGEPQSGVTSYAHKLSRADGVLDLTQPVSAVLAQWAGMTPEPGAAVEHEGGALKLLHVRRAAVSSDPKDPTVPSDPSGGTAPATAAPGTVDLRDGRAILHLADGALELERVQPAGKPAMDGAAWLRGRGGNAVVA